MAAVSRPGGRLPNCIHSTLAYGEFSLLFMLIICPFKAGHYDLYNLCLTFTCNLGFEGEITSRKRRKVAMVLSARRSIASIAQCILWFCTRM
jgi:hypothetical protein